MKINYVFNWSSSNILTSLSSVGKLWIIFVTSKCNIFFLDIWMVNLGSKKKNHDEKKTKKKP